MNNLVDIGVVSLSLPAVVLCLTVLVQWVPEAWQAIFKKRRDPADWLVLGVFVSFTGITTNMSWWTVYWFQRLMEMSGADWWLTTGSVVNLFSRQGAVILAAFCHLKAYQTFAQQDQTVRRPESLLLWTVGASALLFIFIFWIDGS